MSPAADFPRAYMVGLGFEKGHGTPVQPPGQDGLYSSELIPFPGLAGPRTNVDRPALPPRPVGTDAGDATPVTNSDAISPMGSLFWERMHILPRVKIDFGNIITQKQDTYELYNAHRVDDKTLTTITNNATPGVTLPDESTPEVAEAQSSMLDSTTTDNCGDAFVLGTMVLRDIIAETNGLPIFDTNIVFDFAGTNDPELLVAGSRLVLIPFEYEAPTKETLAFLTDIITSLDGQEQRIALRKQPRQVFEVTYLLTENDRQRMQALLMEWTNNLFGFPLWHEQTRTTAAVSAGATQYAITGGDDIDFRVGGLAVVFTDNNTFDVITISAKTDTLITASDPSVNAYPAGTKLMPLRTARILGAVPGSRAINNLERFKVQFEVSDNDTGALTGDTTPGFWSTYNSRVLFDDCNVIRPGAEMRERYSRRIYRIDNATGVVDVSSTWDRNKREHQKGFMLRNRADIITFRKLMLALRGRQKAFYIPTFIEDLTVKADLVISTDTMDIERIEYERFIQSRLPKGIFRITFTDGTSLVRIVQSAAGVDATTERLTLDTTWPAGRTVDEIQRVQFYELCRFDSDNVTMIYPRIGLAECVMPVKQVFDDN